MTQIITPELKQWIVEQVSAGHSPESVLGAMKTAGWQESVALNALEHTLSAHLASKGVDVPAMLTAGDTTDAGRKYMPGTAMRADSSVAEAGAESGKSTQPRLTRHAARTQKPMPEPQLQQSPRQIDLGDRVVDVLLSMARPRVVVFARFLSDEECDGLIEAARPRMARSLTVENATGGEAVNADRTSNGMFFRRAESELVARIESRIARLLNWPVENGEGVQVLNYQPGAEYKPHYDYFDPDAPGTPVILKRGGQRVGTLVMYLNNPERGGGTTFPDVGLEVAPQRGNAVFFAYDRPHPSSQTLHGGAPVISGEKWVATKWLRESEFV
ncbi:MAG TPA: 2OG-Fe(II) oxygenase [Burkholderiaceae bacterium]|nr:2OG-Fe(II) oxygenase [Burkholderiaceae bacterium]